MERHRGKGTYHIIYVENENIRWNVGDTVILIRRTCTDARKESVTFKTSNEVHEYMTSLR